MTGIRLDKQIVGLGLVPTRSQAESYIKLGEVKVNGKIITKAGYIVSGDSKIELTSKEQYVSRAALKLASIARSLELDFKNKVILDVGSSTGGFTDYALKHGASKVIAVDVGTNQLHQSLHGDARIELHEQTDIRDFKTNNQIDMVLIDASFISLRQILSPIKALCSSKTQVVAMVKPQFEAGESGQKNRGVIKNERLRRQILRDFESWVQNLFKVANKADSRVTGQKGNRERFYMLKLL